MRSRFTTKNGRGEIQLCANMEKKLLMNIQGQILTFICKVKCSILVHEISQFVWSFHHNIIKTIVRFCFYIQQIKIQAITYYNTLTFISIHIQHVDILCIEVMPILPQLIKCIINQLLHDI